MSVVTESKSKEIQSLKGEIDKLELQKLKILDWQKNKEKELSALAEKRANLIKEINAEKSDLVKKKQALEVLLHESSKKDTDASKKLSELKRENAKLEAQTIKNNELLREIKREKTEVSALISELNTRRDSINALLDSVEKLRK